MGGRKRGGEAAAAAALECMTRRHLSGLLARDSERQAAAMHEALGALQRLLAAADPALYVRLRDLDITPDMYAVRPPPACTPDPARTRQ